MEKNEPTIYNYTKEFKNDCLQAIITLKQFCITKGIPFYMTFATANNEKETEYITSKQLPPECETTIVDDKFRRIVLAEHGFDLVLNNIDSFDIDDVCDGLIQMTPPAESSEE